MVSRSWCSWGACYTAGPPGEEPDRETLKRAAAIAAYHSKARRAGLVAVSCTRARMSPSLDNAKTGTVQIRKEVVLKVRPAAASEELATNMGNESVEKTKGVGES